MASDAVDGIRLKVDRGREHLTFLYGEIQRYVKDRSIIGDFDAKAGDYIFRVSGDSPPLSWGVVLGEALYDLRSALDQTLFQLIVARGHRPGPFVQFPIVDKEEGWRSEARRRLRGVSADDRTFIKGKQPFNNRTWEGRLIPKENREFFARFHPLSIVGRYNNADKHRVILVAAAVEPRWTDVEVVRDVGTHKGVRIRSGVDYNDRTEVIRVHGVVPSGPHPEYRLVGPSAETLSGIGRDPKMKVELRPRVEVAFGNPRDKPGKIGTVTIDQLGSAIPAVTEIVDHFEAILRGIAP